MQMKEIRAVVMVFQLASVLTLCPRNAPERRFFAVQQSLLPVVAGIRVHSTRLHGFKWKGKLFSDIIEKSPKKTFDFAARGELSFFESMATIGDMHEDVLVEILSYVPARELVRTCRVVCRMWKDLVDGIHIWKGKCIREGYFKKNGDVYPKNWKVFYFLQSLKKNLLKNPCAEEGFNHWTIDHNGGDNWKIEALPGGLGSAFPDRHIKNYFVTSYGLCQKSQLIDLVANGLWENLLDEFQPKIVVSDWYAARRDCGCVYSLEVKLLSKSKTVLKRYKSKEIKIPQWSDAKWNQLTHVFEAYGRGVRFVWFSHKGQDTQFWAGWYGVRVTNSSVTVEP
ncbi:F-box only protein 6-like isoform X3 [Rhincodon typus]|uniref:F-box only protein 6-like isoform X3 n=1 Tax=Rhincodon typus TaxID=259920 RepID=UPI0020309400|nr:F-box only protein 6-like isoform X3 [Rhincodon typus]